MSNKRTSVFRAISFLVLKCGMYGVPYRAGTQTDPELLCPYAEITSQLRHHEVLTSTKKSLEIRAIVRSGAQFAIEISLLHDSLGRRPQGSNTEYVDSSTVTIFATAARSVHKMPTLDSQTVHELRESRARGSFKIGGTKSCLGIYLLAVSVAK